MILSQLRNGALPCAVLAFLAGASAAQAEVRLTEVDINDASQRVELLNTGPDPVDLTGWSLRTTIGNFALGGVINANQHRVFTLPPLTPIIRKRGDCLELFDPNLDAAVDRTDFGDSGGAPLDIEASPASSLARAKGTADPSGASSGHNWTVDFSSTFGAANNAPPPNFVPAVRLNEIIPQGATIRAELHNRAPAGVDLSGYRLSNGRASIFLAGVIPAGGFAVFDITALDFEFSLNIYLFRGDEVRIDQLGLSDAPGNLSTWNQVESGGESLGRFPDGEGPAVGFDLRSSGFPSSLQRMTPTPGAPNRGIGGGTAAVPLSSTAALATALLVIVLAARHLGGRSGPSRRSGLAGPGAAR